MTRLTIFAAIVAALTLTLGTGAADAHKSRTPRQTTVAFQDLPGPGNDRVSGQVALGAKPQEPDPGGGEPLAAAAGGGSCLAGQKVLIKHTLTAEGGGSAPPTLVATAVTDATGAWAATYEASGGTQLMFDSFQIEVVKKRLPPKNARHKHVCLGAFANTTVFSY